MANYYLLKIRDGVTLLPTGSAQYQILESYLALSPTCPECRKARALYANYLWVQPVNTPTEEQLTNTPIQVLQEFSNA